MDGIDFGIIFIAGALLVSLITTIISVAILYSISKSAIPFIAGKLSLDKEKPLAYFISFQVAWLLISPLIQYIFLIFFRKSGGQEYSILCSPLYSLHSYMLSLTLWSFDADLKYIRLKPMSKALGLACLFILVQFCFSAKSVIFHNNTPAGYYTTDLISSMVFICLALYLIRQNMRPVHFFEPEIIE